MVNGGIIVTSLQEEGYRHEHRLWLRQVPLHQSLAVKVPAAGGIRCQQRTADTTQRTREPDSVSELVQKN